MSNRAALTLAAVFLIAAVCAVWSHQRVTETDSDADVPGDSAGIAQIIGAADPKTFKKGNLMNPGAPAANDEAFAKAANEALGTMPKTAEILAKNTDFHYAPAEILDGTAAFAAIWDSLKQNPELAPQGLGFYRDCAKDEQAPTAIRAVCLRHMKDLAARTQTGPIDESEFPELVRRVADKMPSETRWH